MEGLPGDFGLKRERSLNPGFPEVGFFEEGAAFAWSLGVGDGTDGRDGAGEVGGVTALGGVTGMRVAPI